MPRKSTEFSSFSWPESQLNSARFFDLEINIIQLILMPRKSTEIRSFCCLENQQNSAKKTPEFTAKKMNWITLMTFFSREKTVLKVYSFSGVEIH